MIIVWFACRLAYPMLWTVYVGLIEQPVSTVQSLAVEKIIFHGRYRPKGLDHDIALMKLVQPLIFNGTFCKRSSFNLESGFFELAFLMAGGYANGHLILSRPSTTFHAHVLHSLWQMACLLDWCRHFSQVLWNLFVCRTLGRSLRMVKCAGSQDGAPYLMVVSLGS